MPRMPPSIDPSEDAIQMAVAQYLNLCDVLWHHSPNGGWRHPATAARMRSAGTSPGMPDIMVYSAPPRELGKIGAAMELKRDKGGRLAPAQRLWLDGLKAAGWATAVCCGLDEALAMLADWGYRPVPGRTPPEVTRAWPVRRKARRPTRWHTA